MSSPLSCGFLMSDKKVSYANYCLRKVHSEGMSSRNLCGFLDVSECSREASYLVGSHTVIKDFSSC